MKLLLFIPVYNCEKQIVRVLDTLQGKIMDYVSKILIINNRSTDNTEGVVIYWMQQHPEIPLELIRNDENYGLGGSHKVAFCYALSFGFDYVAILHGDDQGSICDLLPVLETGQYLKYDCCLGARFMKGSSLPGYSRLRTFGNRIFNLLFSIVTGLHLYDLGAGINLYRVDMLKDKFFWRFPDNLVFNYCMSLAMSSLKQTHIFFPIVWKEEDQLSNVKLFSQAKRICDLLITFALHRHIFSSMEFRDTIRETYTFKTVKSNST